MSGERYPSSGPVRVSAVERLRTMRSPQELMDPDSTSMFRYEDASEDRLDPPVVIEVPSASTDMPYTQGNSRVIRQSVFPERARAELTPEQIRQAIEEGERMAMAEFYVEGQSARMAPSPMRTLNLELTGPDESVTIKVTESVNGSRIGGIVSALSGQAMIPEGYAYPDQLQIEGTSYLPAEPVQPEYTTPSRRRRESPTSYADSHRTVSDRDEYVIKGSAEKKPRKKMTSAQKRLTRIAVMLALSPSLMSFSYEFGKQLAHFNLISAGDAFKAATFQNITPQPDQEKK